MLIARKEAKIRCVRSSFSHLEGDAISSHIYHGYLHQIRGSVGNPPPVERGVLQQGCRLFAWVDIRRVRCEFLDSMALARV